MMGCYSTAGEITEAFNILDQDHSDQIDFTEFANFVSAIKPDIDTNQLLNYIRKVDRNNDLRINRSEFSKLILSGLGKDIVDGQLV
jgi:Ca2+-binding EF-hand superfamily protein